MYETSRGAEVKARDIHATDCGFNFPLEEIKYFIFSI